VAHVGKETALRHRGCFGYGLRMLELHGARLHQFLEVVTVRIELAGDLFFLGV
jgi:hypothetical protein